MIKVSIKTNLDIREKWPTELEGMPAVGDYIVSETVHRRDDFPYQVRLKVLQITWTPCSVGRGTIPIIELGLPANFTCGAQFTAWYDFITGKISQDHYAKLADRAMRAANHGRPFIYNPDLMYDAMNALTPLWGELRKLPHEQFGLAVSRLESVVTKYMTEDKLFPMRICIDVGDGNGKEQIIKRAEDLPLATSFIILERGCETR